MADDRLWVVPKEGLPLFDGFEVELEDLEAEVRKILWPIVDQFPSLEQTAWRVGDLMERGSLRTIVRMAAVELNRHGVLADGSPPVVLERASVTCYVPEDCTDLWYQAAMWHAAVATVQTLMEGQVEGREEPRQVYDRLWEQARPRLVETWTELAERLGVEPDVLDVW